MATTKTAPKNNVQIAEIHARTQIAAGLFGIVKSAIAAGSAVGCVWLVVDGLKSIVLANPASISALAKVVENFQLSHIVGALVGCAGVGYGLLERRGKKRLLSGYARDRRIAESGDPYHASSGLTESGDTPQVGD